ncbi:MAG: 5'-methylthioadenosine/S-adenosylhomocysteine nucleosidase [Rhizobiaceae bacterium]
MNEGTVKRVGKHRVLYVMAAQAEYGLHLRQRFEPLICHVGPVEAALNVARRLALEPEIDCVISLGSAGSCTLEQAQVYQVSAVDYRDMDASALGFKKGVTPFLDCPPVIDLPYCIDGLPAASIATGASIVSGAAYDGIEADMVDMESYAIARASMKSGVPMIGLRGISDGAHPVAELSDWTRYLEVIDKRLGTVVDLLEAQIADGSLLSIEKS